MTPTLVFVAVLVVCGLMLWGSYKIEPHWVSRDGERVVCYGQGISNRGEPYGRWRELRLTKLRNGTVEVRPRHGSIVKDRHADGASIAGVAGMAGFAGAMKKRRGQRISYWRVNGASADPPPRRIIYLLDGNDDPAMPELIAIRLPTKSRAIPMLEELAINKSKLVKDLLSARHPETPRPPEQPDPG
ncbi:MAG: hypothetical protein ABIW84_08635 [Ilumatobacteraceae bacterium]